MSSVHHLLHDASIPEASKYKVLTKLVLETKSLSFRPLLLGICKCKGQAAARPPSSSHDCQTSRLQSVHIDLNFIAVSSLARLASPWERTDAQRREDRPDAQSRVGFQHPITLVVLSRTCRGAMHRRGHRPIGGGLSGHTSVVRLRIAFNTVM